MKLKRILIMLALLLPAICLADVSNDRLMATISRDSQKYLSADVRDASEEAARKKAAEELLAKVKDYLKSDPSLGISPESFSSATLSGVSHELSSKISDTRFRVLLYVEKSELNPARKTADAPAAAASPTKTATAASSSGVSAPQGAQPQKPAAPAKTAASSESSPVVRMISQLSTRQEVAQKLKELHASRTITGGASFPLANANDFYVVVIDGDRVLTTLHFLNGKYIDGATSKEVDIDKFARYSGYWFTLPNSK